MTPSTFISRINYFARTVISDADGLNLFNLCYRELQGRAPWRWLELSSSISVVGESLVDLPSNCGQLKEVLRDGVHCDRVEYIDRDKYTVDSNVYYLLGAQIAFPGYSSPGATNNVTLTYLQGATDLALVSDSPLCGADFDPWFIQQGLSYFWQREGNYGKSSNHLSLAENEISSLIAVNAKPVRGELRRAKHVSELYPRRY